MIKWLMVMLGWMGAVSVSGEGLTNLEVRANADRVNLRARPDSTTEVVGQVEDGQGLSVVKVQGEWFGVLAPTSALVWVKGQFVAGGKISGDKIRMRSGPGISYRDMGLLRSGTPVTPLETRGEWVRIVPPPELVLWVNQSMVTQQVAVAVAAAPLPAAPVEAPAAAATCLTLPTELPAGLTRAKLAPVLGQGALAERTGLVERVPLAFWRGVDYRLVEIREGSRVTVCFLQGNAAQMPSLLGRKLKVKGREYWLRNQRHAVLYPELITPVME